MDMRDDGGGRRADHPGGPTTAVTWVVDDQGLVAVWSKAAERLLGYTGEQAVGAPAARLLGLAAAEASELLLTGPGPDRATAVLRHRDGRRVEVELQVRSSLDARGRPQRLVMAVPAPAEHPPADTITVEDAFRQCHLPVAIFDDQLRVLRASEGLIHEFGRSEGQVHGHRLADLLPRRVREELEPAIHRVLAGGAPETLQVHSTASAGRERIWAVTLSPLLSPTGEVHHLQLTALDTTDQYWARERLALLNDVSTRVGSTLDVTRTAQEMADVAVGRLADFVTVDLLDSLFRGEEPAPRAGAAGVTLRRAAQASVLPGAPESVTRPGSLDHYPPESPPARCLATGRSALHSTADDAISRWASADPARAGVLHAFGVHSVMAIPLRARGITLGIALLVRHRRPESFDEDDLLLAEEIAARAAVAVDNARRYTRERTTAMALQRSLLPLRIADQDAVEVTHRYLPTLAQAGVGGDWFDVIPLSGARVALVVGDVVGHGLRSSAIMGRLRTAVRTLADVDLTPDELLVRLDDLVTLVAAQEVIGGPGPPADTDLVATCLYVVYDPVSRVSTAASAGHPPPAVVTPDGTAEFIDIAPGPPLGVGGQPFEVTVRRLPAGSILALYTDGLLDVPGRGMEAGLALLRDCLHGTAGSLEAVCETLLNTLLPERPTDDVALLVARTRALDAEQVAGWDVPLDPAAVAEARAWASERLSAWGLREASFAVELVVSELVTNAIRHGSPPVHLRLIRCNVIVCEVSDGSSTAPHLRRAQTFDEGGRGLMLVAQVTRRWGARYTPAGKIIWAEVTLPLLGTGL